MKASKNFATIVERFHPKYTKGPGCWEWHGAKTPRGYGLFRIDSDIPGYAHRFSYQLYVGEIPDKTFVCHTCDNPSCVNPKHLFLGTAKDNSADMMKKKRWSIKHRARGAKHGMAKLSLNDCKAIVALDRAGVPRTEIARRYKLHYETVSKVCRGDHWSKKYLHE